MAIDAPNVISPEDSFTVAEYEDGSFYVAVSFPEVGILDPEANTVKHIISDLTKSPRKSPGCKIPTERSKMTYCSPREMPSLTVQGIYKPGRGISNANIVRSKVLPELYTYEDTEQLDDNEHYHAAKRFAYLFAKHNSRVNHRGELSNSTFNSYNIGPGTVTEQFMIFANTVTGRLSQHAHLPQLYRIHPDNTHERPKFRSRPGYHEGLNTQTYCGMSNPLRELTSWVSHVSVSYYLENGEAPCSRSELQKLAEWLNNSRGAQITPEGVIVRNTVEPIGAEAV